MCSVDRFVGVLTLLKLKAEEKVCKTVVDLCWGSGVGEESVPKLRFIS
jgi:hypothetical protein